MQKLKTSLLNVVDPVVVKKFIKFEDDKITISNGRTTLVVSKDSVDNYLLRLKDASSEDEEVAEQVLDVYVACMLIIAKVTLCPLSFRE